MFATIPLAAFMLLLFALTVLNKRAIDNFKIENNITTLFVGDSHIEKAMNDSLIANSLNIAQNSESYYFTYYKLKRILDANSQIKNVYLGYSYHSLSNYQHDFVFGKFSHEIAARYFFILPINEQLKIIAYNLHNFNEFTKNLVTMGIKNVITDKNNFSFGGGFKNDFENSAVISKSVFKRLALQYYKMGGVRGFSETNISYLQNIAALCRQKKVNLVLLQTPLQSLYAANVPIAFRQKLVEVIQQNEFTFVDYERLPLNDSCFIPDGDHLSAIGANQLALVFK